MSGRNVSCAPYNGRPVWDLSEVVQLVDSVDDIRIKLPRTGATNVTAVGDYDRSNQFDTCLVRALSLTVAGRAVGNPNDKTMPFEQLRFIKYGDNVTGFFFDPGRGDLIVSLTHQDRIGRDSSKYEYSVVVDTLDVIMSTSTSKDNDSCVEFTIGDGALPPLAWTFFVSAVLFLLLAKRGGGGCRE
jgi:hypothetical protein